MDNKYGIVCNPTKGYVKFLERCPNPSEILPVLLDDKQLLLDIKEAASEFCLFASPKANLLSMQYFFTLGKLIAFKENESQEFVLTQEEATSHYGQFLNQMRKDSLGLTWFGI